MAGSTASTRSCPGRTLRRLSGIRARFPMTEPSGSAARSPLLMTRSRLVIVTLGIVLAVVVGGYIAYDQILRGDSVAALALPSSSPSKAPAASTAPEEDATASPAAGSSGDP